MSSPSNETGKALPTFKIHSFQLAVTDIFYFFQCSMLCLTKVQTAEIQYGLTAVGHICHQLIMIFGV